MQLSEDWLANQIAGEKGLRLSGAAPKRRVLLGGPLLEEATPSGKLLFDSRIFARYGIAPLCLHEDIVNWLSAGQM
jgi:hypothetical protein